MSAIHDLIAQISDPRLRERLTTEWAKASQDKKFGLVFEGAKSESQSLVASTDNALHPVGKCSEATNNAARREPGMG